MALYDEKFKDKIFKLPKEPGVYQYFDALGNIIYIGKAKNLKNRVSSYLNKANQSSKTLLLVKKVEDLKFIVVKTEQDALLLENNLIKKYKPKYNILLKDDKTYPWICIKKEMFPRVYITRKFFRTDGEYFGPYTSVRFANTLIALIKKIFKYRTCNLALTETNIASMKFKVCLEYHIGNCPAPCVGYISKYAYDDMIMQIRNILKGNYSVVIEYLEKLMMEYSLMMKFESAQTVKESLELLRNHHSKSMIVRSSVHDIDVFSYYETDKYSYINYLKITYGAVNQVHTIEIERKVDEESSEILSDAIFEIRQLLNSTSKEIVVPFMPEFKMDGLIYTIPSKGDKKQLLELSHKNALAYCLDKQRQRALLKKENSAFSVLLSMKNDLKLPCLPRRIECFDNSNIQGTNPVAACVVFINGKPAKKEYRKFHIKTVIGADDYASMEEIVYRRYKRVLEEGGELPDLIVIDGGKGQLHSALLSLEKLDLAGKISILGLAEKLEEIYYPGDKEAYILSKTSHALNILMQIRDEAHRFGITFHRALRSKAQIKSVLTEIDGIGPATESLLLREFKSVENIKKLSQKRLAEVLGDKKAKLVFDYLKEQ